MSNRARALANESVLSALVYERDAYTLHLSLPTVQAWALLCLCCRFVAGLLSSIRIAAGCTRLQ